MHHEIGALMQSQIGLLDIASTTTQRVIAIAASDPAVGPLTLANPGAHWEVVYSPASHRWPLR